MADAGAWDQGWALGANAAQRGIAQKQDRANVEWEDKHNDLRDAIANTRAKVWSIPKDSPDYETQHAQGLQDLTQAIQAYQDFLHPVKNPGVFDKVKHLIGLNEHPLAPSVTAQAPPIQLPPSTGIEGTGTSPVIPAAPPVSVSGPSQNPKQLKAEAQSRQKAQTTASQMDAAAPLSPQQQATQQAQAAVAGEEAKANWQLDWAKRHNVPQSALDELTQHIAGVPNVTKLPKPEGQPYKDANDGKYYQRYLNPDGTDSRREVPGYSPTTHPSTSVANEVAASYAKAHGTTVESLTPEAWDYLLKKTAYDKAMPTSTTTTTLKQNMQGQWVPVTETNYKTPGGNISLVDPMGSVAKQESPKDGSGASSTPPKGSTDTMVVPKPKGIVEAGNIPIWNRPTVQNADGSHSTEYSTSREEDGKEVLVPTVVDGKFLTPDGKKPPEGSPEEKAMFDRAWDYYKKTGQNLGKFDNADDSDAYANILHNRGEKKSVKDLKTEAKAREPKKGASSTSSDNPKGSGNTRVGGPLFAAPNKEYNDAKAAYDGAVHRTSLMEKNLKSALKDHDQQAMLSLVANHIGMTLGAQKGARINQAVWNEAVASAPWLQAAAAKFDDRGYLSGVTLTPEQMKQMVNLAHESTEVAKEDVGRIEQRLNEGVTNPTGSTSSSTNSGQSKGIVSVTEAMKKPKYKGKSRQEVSDAITKAGYTPSE